MSGTVTASVVGPNSFIARMFFRSFGFTLERLPCNVQVTLLNTRSTVALLPVPAANIPHTRIFTDSSSRGICLCWLDKTSEQRFEKLALNETTGSNLRKFQFASRKLIPFWLNVCHRLALGSNFKIQPIFLRFRVGSAPAFFEVLPASRRGN